jgi:sulfite exporter TauE/SafE
MELSLLFSATMIGIFGSGHCLAMCGGIACAPSFTGQGTGSLAPIFLFNGGRITGYVLIGALAGLLGQTLAVSPDILILLRTIAALLLIAMGLYVAQWWSGITFIEKIGVPVWNKLSPVATSLRHSKSALAPFGLGLLWGWLPCGLVYSALSWSIASAEARTSAILMLFFGLGTLPSMLSAGVFSFQFRKWLSHRNTRRFFGVLMILMGLWTLPALRILAGFHH